MKRLAGLISVAGLVFTVGCAQTDAGITTAVKSKMAADDTVKAYQINVDTQNHVVTLTGDVESSAAKERAVLIARETNGVNDVVDHLVIRETAATSGIDVDVNVDPSLKREADRAGDQIVDGTKNVGEEIKEGAIATKEGAKKVGSKIVDAVTDKDRDSDKDGK